MPLVDKLLTEYKRKYKLKKLSKSQSNAFYRDVYTNTYKNDYKLKYELYGNNTLYIRHDYDVIPAQRPKVSRFNTYYPTRYKHFKEYYINELGIIKKDVGDLFFNCNLSLKITVYGDKRTLRSDVDNLAKTVMDCLELSGIIENDNKIHNLNVVKGRTADDMYKTLISLGVL